MRYALLDVLACQACHSELACFTYRERPSEIPAGPFEGGTRVGTGPGLSPLPATAQSGELTARLRTFAQPAADPARNFAIEIDEGILLCPQCGRWYPIAHRLPEILPDHLRDFDADAARMRDAAAAMPPALADAALKFRPADDPADSGAHYKQAEMSITGKIDDPKFFGPGYTAPYNVWNPEFTLHLISLFGTTLRLLDLRQNERVLDTACGYAWTTEWLHRSGVPVVGIDISRTYLDIAMERIGDAHPHLVVGDVENLPLRTAAFDAVLGFESFHHVPDRARAMAGFDRVLDGGGRVILAEPGSAHEQAPVSVDAMRKYGILERGMELADVCAYAAGSALIGIEQVFFARSGYDDIGRRLDALFLTHRSSRDGNLFRLRKGGVSSRVPRVEPPARRVWPTVKRYIKRGLFKVGLD
jgi:SAM-dependent methyltransferase/uncharacterized protein YbaR (Trm112 family)